MLTIPVVSIGPGGSWISTIWWCLVAVEFKLEEDESWVSKEWPKMVETRDMEGHSVRVDACRDSEKAFSNDNRSLKNANDIHTGVRIRRNVDYLFIPFLLKKET